MGLDVDSVIDVNKVRLIALDICKEYAACADRKSHLHQHHQPAKEYTKYYQRPDILATKKALRLRPPAGLGELRSGVWFGRCSGKRKQTDSGSVQDMLPAYTTAAM